MKKPKRGQRWKQRARLQVERLEDRLPPGDWRALPVDWPFLAADFGAVGKLQSFSQSRPDAVESPLIGQGTDDSLSPPPEVGGGPRETGPGIDLITPSGAWAVEQLFESLEAWNPQVDFGLQRLHSSPPPFSHQTPFQAAYAGAPAQTAFSAGVYHGQLEADPGQLRALTGLAASGSIGDTDHDGVGDATEALARHAGDGNQDGIADRFQSSVASLRSAGGQMVTLDAGGHALRGVRLHNAPRDAKIRLPYGLFSFDIANVSPGGSATLRMILPEDATPTAYFKTVSPLPLGGEGLGVRGLSRFDFDGTTGARIAGNVVTLHYVDGGRGDADGIANGVIVDPGGPGQNPPTVTAGPDVQGAETQPITINGGISDPDGASMFPPYTVTINWGDGSQNSTLSMMSPSPFSSTHTYADDGVYTITVTGTDPTGLTGTDTAQATIGTVQSVEWIDNYPGQLSANPNPGLGIRVYPDRLLGDTPEQAGARRWVKLKVTVGIPNVEVYVTVFDVDDPSTNIAVVDNELESTDNRGLGGLSFPPQTTNAAGNVELAFQVSMQPGDNYRAVATCHLAALDELYAEQDDGTLARVFDAAPVPDAPLPNDKVKVSELLTVWRRLHVEVDSMGARGWARSQSADRCGPS